MRCGSSLALSDDESVTACTCEGWSLVAGRLGEGMCLATASLMLVFQATVQATPRPPPSRTVRGFKNSPKGPFTYYVTRWGQEYPAMQQLRSTDVLKFAA